MATSPVTSAPLPPDLATDAGEEALEGTVARAIDRWRKAQEKHATELVVVREVRIAKSQPRPMARG